MRSKKHPRKDIVVKEQTKHLYALEDGELTKVESEFLELPPKIG